MDNNKLTVTNPHPMQEFDQQLNLLTREVQHLKKTSHIKQPFLINPFNHHFDKSLRQLVMEYAFDFDKIALHLYYEFPQYDQRINYKTVTFRWWQITVGDMMENIKARQDDNRQMNHINQGDKGGNKEDYLQDDDKVEILTDNLFPFFEKPMENASFSTISTQSYSKAMELSQILTEQESQRFILYKPKFIIDTEYQLQRYEVDDGWVSAEQKADSFSQLVIDKLLKKVVSNEFEYDEFGGFNDVEREQKHEKNKKNGVKDKNKWWQNQEESQSEYQQSEEEVQVNNNENKDQIEQNAAVILDDQINDIKEKAYHQIKEQPHLPKQRHEIRVYDIDEDWEQYESD